jgi:hypothetical protein
MLSCNRQAWLMITSHAVSDTPNEKHRQIATTKFLIGFSLAEQKRFREAESLLLEAFPIIQENFSSNRRRTQDTIQHIINLYEAWGKPEQAAAYRSLLEIQEKK